MNSMKLTYRNGFIDVDEGASFAHWKRSQSFPLPANEPEEEWRTGSSRVPCPFARNTGPIFDDARDKRTSNGTLVEMAVNHLQPNCDGLQPISDGLHPRICVTLLSIQSLINNLPQTSVAVLLELGLVRYIPWFGLVWFVILHICVCVCAMFAFIKMT